MINIFFAGPSAACQRFTRRKVLMRYKNCMQIFFYTLNVRRVAAFTYILCKMVLGLMLPLTAYIMQNFIDAILTSFSSSMDLKSMVYFFIILSVIYIFEAIEEPISGYCKLLISEKLNYKFDCIILKKLEAIDYAHFENCDRLDLINRVNGTAGVQAFNIFENILLFVSVIIKITGTFVLLARYNWVISLGIVLIAIPIIYFAGKHGKNIHDWYQKNSKKRRTLEYLSSLFINRNISLEMKEYDSYEYIKSKWRNQSKDLRIKDFHLQLGAWKNTIISSTLLNFLEYSAYIFMLIPLFAGTITIGMFVGISKAIAGIEGLIIWKFSSIISFFSQNKRYWDEYNLLLDFSEIKNESEIIETQCVVNGGISIEFDDVSFQYENMEEEILSHINFKVGINEICGLVGENGAGKSTITKLMIGLYKPNSGNIYIDGKNTKEMSFDEQVSYFAVTYQDYKKYNISVRENIKLRDTYEKFSENIAYSLDVLGFDYQKLPNGLDTILGKLFGEGIELSGGEWQKIAIARMLCSEAPFYIMDEPTASLDPISEAELYAQVKSVLMAKTSLLITHRLGATRYCNRILVLKDKKIVENGSFKELMAKGGVYAAMYREQRQWYVK